MVSDGLGHLSKKTRERAFILARNARALGITLGAVRFTPHHDYISYYLASSDDYIIIFCTPSGYLLEIWSENDSEVSSDFFCIKNIRHFLQWAKKLGYQDIDTALDDIDWFDEEEN